MTYKIHETCSCGAILDYEEEVDEALSSHLSYRQTDFHKAHEDCRVATPQEDET